MEYVRLFSNTKNLTVTNVHNNILALKKYSEFIISEINFDNSFDLIQKKLQSFLDVGKKIIFHISDIYTSSKELLDFLNEIAHNERYFEKLLIIFQIDSFEGFDISEIPALIQSPITLYCTTSNEMRSSLSKAGIKHVFLLQDCYTENKSVVYSKNKILCNNLSESELLEVKYILRILGLETYEVHNNLSDGEGECVFISHKDALSLRYYLDPLKDGIKIIGRCSLSIQKELLQKNISVDHLYSSLLIQGKDFSEHTLEEKKVFVERSLLPDDPRIVDTLKQYIFDESFFQKDSFIVKREFSSNCYYRQLKKIIDFGFTNSFSVHPFDGETLLKEIMKKK